MVFSWGWTRRWHPGRGDEGGSGSVSRVRAHHLTRHAPMDRDAQSDEARRNAWETATSVTERIDKLTQVATEYPESMITFTDIAASYLAMDDLDNARRTNQHIVDHQRQFALIWANELGKAYLFTNDYGK